VLESLPLEERLVEAAVVAERFGEAAVKKSLRWAGSGVMGEDSMEDVSGEVAGVLRKLREMWEKSDSSAERREALDDVLEMERMSGAFRACTLVVERSSVGSEILERSMVPAGYR
jgi:hypothetical protein